MLISSVRPRDPHAHAAHVLSLLRGVPDDTFRPLTTIARQLIGTPMAAVNFIEGDLLWNKVASGIALDPMPRAQALCDWTVATDETLVVPDASVDPRFDRLPLVTEGGLRFYAGVPIRVTDRETGTSRAIGSLCIADVRVRETDEALAQALRALSDVAQTLIEMHVAAERAIDIAALANTQAEALFRQERIFHQAERMAMIGSWRLTPANDMLHWSNGVRRIHELPDDAAPSVAEALNYYPPHAHAMVADTIAHAARTGEPFDFETDFVTAKGNARRVRAIGEVEMTDGKAAMITGVFQDVTARWRMEQQLRQTASVDALTGIANRAAFDVALDAALARLGRDAVPCTLVLIDLDHFKEINDTHGHPIGDDVLREVARRLLAAPFRDAMPVRLGGDEFAMILTGDDVNPALDQRVETLCAALARPVVANGVTIASSATIGYADAEPGITPRELTHRADTALYRAKRAGRGRVSRFQPYEGVERRDRG